jgi:hypothetical protein
VTSKPIFEAGTERFIRDWRNTIVTVTVRDERMREHDPILGVVPLKLSEIFQTSSQLTRWFPLDAGLVGCLASEVLTAGIWPMPNFCPIPQC